MMSGVATMAFGALTGFMLCYQVWAAARNVTAIEELYSGDNPYRQSSTLDNLRQIFGEFDRRLLFPVEPVRGQLLGTSFPISDQAVSHTIKGNNSTNYGSV